MTTRHRFEYWPLEYWPLIMAGCVLLLVLSGCATGSNKAQVASLADSGTASATPASTADLEKELDTYVECLRKQGVNVPDPTVDAEGRISFGRATNGLTFDRDKLQAAQKVCGDPPAGLTAGFDEQDQAALQDTALKFTKCMRAEGIDVPDPVFSKIGQGDASPFGDLDQDDPKVAAAIEVCQKVWTEAGIIGRGGN